MPMVPKLNSTLVDVRDVAKAHIIAMTLPEAAGNRHILSTGNIWFVEIAKVSVASLAEWRNITRNENRNSAPETKAW